MKSKASLKSHPIHPILIAFPIAFFIGTLLFDLLALFYDNDNFRNTARYLVTAGIIAGLIAAVPGIVDYIFTVPPKSSAKKRATLHGLTNTGSIIIFSVALYYRQQQSPAEGIVITLESLGVIAMMIAGWMGGTLVYRNQIGVDPRYAHAGKWKEVYLDDTASVEVATSEELKVNQMKLIHIKDKRIVLGRTEKGYVAFDDRCTHKGGSLAGGALMCNTVQCPWHGSQFNVETGAVTAGPAKEGISTYTIQEVDGRVLLII